MYAVNGTIAVSYTHLLISIAVMCLIFTGVLSPGRQAANQAASVVATEAPTISPATAAPVSYTHLSSSEISPAIALQAAIFISSVMLLAIASKAPLKIPGKDVYKRQPSRWV